MKTFVIKGADRFQYSKRPDNRLDMFIEGEDAIVTASDGYHTFDELYEHRITLFIALCRELAGAGRYRVLSFHPVGEVVPRENHIWRSRKHSDGTAYDGWFIMGINKEKGGQITYHLPMSKWVETEFAETLEKAPEWDGHTSNDVLQRLRTEPDYTYKKFRVQVRRDGKFAGRVKPEAELIDGKTFLFAYGWPIGKDDHSLYVGEVAWLPRIDGQNPEYPKGAPGWVPSGDLVPVED